MEHRPEQHCCRGEMEKTRWIYIGLWYSCLVAFEQISGTISVGLRWDGGVAGGITNARWCDFLSSQRRHRKRGRAASA